MLNRAQRAAYTRRYRKGDVQLCPYCGGADLDWQELNVQDAAVTQEVSCMTCDAEWIDVYEFTRIVEE